MDGQLRVVAVLATLMLLVVVLELVRRRRLLERYALVWLGVGLLLLALSVFSGLLDVVSDGIGIEYPPTALFVIAFAFVTLVLLHFSATVSALTDQSKVLAQRLALIEARLRKLEEENPSAGASEINPAESERTRP